MEFIITTYIELPLTDAKFDIDHAGDIHRYNFVYRTVEHKWTERAGRCMPSNWWAWWAHDAFLPYTRSKYLRKSKWTLHPREPHSSTCRHNCKGYRILTMCNVELTTFCRKYYERSTIHVYMQCKRGATELLLPRSSVALACPFADRTAEASSRHFWPHRARLSAPLLIHPHRLTRPTTTCHIIFGYE